MQSRGATTADSLVTSLHWNVSGRYEKCGAQYKAYDPLLASQTRLRNNTDASPDPGPVGLTCHDI